MSPLPLTKGLARFVADPGFEVLPADIEPQLRNAFIDTIACILSGRDETVVKAARASIVEQRGLAQARVLLGVTVADAPVAAFINAVSGHALDFDDMALSGHPSVVLVPALMAVGQSMRASGAQLMRAYLVGYEVWAELARREEDALHEKGWHPTGALGTVAVAAAVSALERITAVQATSALGISASLAGGLIANFGSMTKPLHAGWAARHGIEAVRLAKAGISASTDALESRTGLLRALSPCGRVDLGDFVSEGRSLAFREAGLSVKKYPICYASHRIVDGLIDMQRQHDISAEQIVRVAATLSDVAARVSHHHTPTTALEAKFSLEFACAVALMYGRVGLREITDQNVNNNAVRRLMSLVHIQTVAPGCPIEPAFALHDRVTVELSDGQIFDSGDLRFAHGHAKAPLGSDELRAKFMSCVRPDEEQSAGRLYQQLPSMMGSDEFFDPVLIAVRAF